MNSDPIEKLFNESRNIILSEEKKHIIRQEVIDFIKKNPSKKGDQRVKKKWGFFYLPYSITLKSPAVALAAMAFVLLFTSATSVRASFALPGDFFYPVKVGINEKITQVLAFSDEAKLKVNIALAQVRLYEVEKLAIQGKINKKDQAQVIDSFEEHTDRVSEYALKLREKNDDPTLEKITTSFEASLRAHYIIINQLQKGKQGLPVTPFINKLDNAVSNISKINASVPEVKKDTAPLKIIDKEKNIREKIIQVENSVRATKKLLENSKDSIGAKAVLESHDNLNLVRQKVSEGKEKLLKDGTDYQGLHDLLKEASVIAEESKYLIEAKNKLGVDIPIAIPVKSKLDLLKIPEDESDKAPLKAGGVE